MRIHYAPLSRKAWNDYAKCRTAYAKGEKSHARLVVDKMIDVLENGSRTNLALTFMPYFSAIINKENGNKDITDEVIEKILSRAKNCAKEMAEEEIWMRSNCETFNGIEVKWEDFRPYDEDYNSFDRNSQKVVMPWRFTPEEENEFRERFSIEFHDPYCDGRDCTGAPFTGWMKFLKCKDRTIILHNILYDL